ncbi:hypothetical protein MSC49_32160 [Methylosinus sp. C49]|nr:hypothetical protein MSC49_32160 [Methylosinus sp. C49]
MGAAASGNAEITPTNPTVFLSMDILPRITVTRVSLLHHADMLDPATIRASIALRR